MSDSTFSSHLYTFSKETHIGKKIVERYAQELAIAQYTSSRFIRILIEGLDNAVSSTTISVNSRTSCSVSPWQAQLSYLVKTVL